MCLGAILYSAMTNHDTGKTGHDTSTADPEGFVEVINRLELPSTGNIAGEMGCSPQRALYHLNKLENAGDITSRKAGPAQVWSLAH